MPDTPIDDIAYEHMYDNNDNTVVSDPISFEEQERKKMLTATM